MHLVQPLSYRLSGSDQRHVDGVTPAIRADPGFPCRIRCLHVAQVIIINDQNQGELLPKCVRVHAFGRLTRHGLTHRMRRRDYRDTSNSLQ